MQHATSIKTVVMQGKCSDSTTDHLAINVSVKYRLKKYVPPELKDRKYALACVLA